MTALTFFFLLLAQIDSRCGLACRIFPRQEFGPEGNIALASPPNDVQARFGNARDGSLILVSTVWNKEELQPINITRGALVMELGYGSRIERHGI
jgi:hypothetical protein